MTDDQLLREFISRNAQDAFGEIVRRHINAVYASARRQVRDPQTADDVTQAVFIILAKRAKSLIGRESLAGWLMKTTYFASRDAIRSEVRRRRHEQGAAIAQSQQVPDMNSHCDGISRELDQALAQLNEADRGVVALRYLQGKTTAETAAALQISEPAATKRIQRAVDRLRKILLRKKVIAPAVMLAVVLDEIPRLVAPAHVLRAATIATSASGATPATYAIAKGVIHLIKWNQIKAAMLVIGAILFATGAGVGTVKLLAQENPAPAAAPATATPAPDVANFPPPPDEQTQSGQFIGRLSNGVSMELIGIGEHPSKGKPWWKADGSPLDVAPYAKMNGQIPPAPSTISREVAAKINYKVTGSPDLATVTWEELPSVFSNSSGVYSDVIGSNGRPVSGIETNAIQYSDQVHEVTMHAQVAAGPWNSVATDEDLGGTASRQENDTIFLFSHPFELKGDTHIIVTAVGIPDDQDHRLVMWDKTGHQHVDFPAGGQGRPKAFLGEYRVPGRMTTFTKCEFQIRPFDQWIEIRHVTFRPEEKTKVEIVTSDDPKK